MTDDLIRRFEDGTLPSSEFHHRDHVRLAWLYLNEEPPLTALARFAEGLKRFATRNGIRASTTRPSPGRTSSSSTSARREATPKRPGKSSQRATPTCSPGSPPCWRATTARRRWRRIWRGGCSCCRTGGKRPHASRPARGVSRIVGQVARDVGQVTRCSCEASRPGCDASRPAFDAPRPAFDASCPRAAGSQGRADAGSPLPSPPPLSPQAQPPMSPRA